MSVFFVTFLSLYCAMHLVVWWGIRPIVPAAPSVRWLLIVWSVAMIGALPAVRLLERRGWEAVARTVAWVGYPWLGFLFLAFSLFLLLGGWEGAVALATRLFPQFRLFSLYGARVSAVIVFLAFVCGVYALVEARTLRTEVVRLRVPGLAPNLRGLRIVQISDLHLGLLLGESTVKRMSTLIASLQPDLLVSTGDMVDAQINHLDGLSSCLRELPARYGKFAVLGNHEYYAGLSQAIDFTEKSGFVLLRDKVATPVPGLSVVGIDDPVGSREEKPGNPFSVPPGDFFLLLKHRPEVGPSHFDLQLSGHAHRGQIFPFSLLTYLRYPLQDGLTALAGGGYLYVSRGTGTWGPPMRLFSPPEVTLIVLEGEDAPKKEP